jgi:hypothetical protein
MSQLGHKRKWPRLNGMSVLPPTADVVGPPRYVRFVPKPEVAGLFNHLVGAANSASGTVTPGALADFRMTINSTVMDRCTELLFQRGARFVLEVGAAERLYPLPD